MSTNDTCLCGQVTSLRREREMLISKQQSGGNSEAQRMRECAGASQDEGVVVGARGGACPE